MCVPEGEDGQTGDDEDCSKYDEDVVTGISPPSIVEHFCRLSVGERKTILSRLMMQMIYINFFDKSREVKSMR